MKTIIAKQRTGLLLNRNYRLLWLGQTISPLGDFFLTTTLILWLATQLARGQAWAAMAIGGVALASALATLIVGPLAGVFVDRWDKRRTMLRMDCARGLLVLALLVLTGLLPAPLSLQLPLAMKLTTIYIVLFLIGVCSQFFGPSRMALIGDIVEKEQRAQAMGLSQAAFNTALILGPMLAAPLFLATGARWAMLIDTASFFVSYLCILLIKAPPPARSVSENEHSRYLRELRAGWETIVNNRALTALIVNGILLLAGAGTLDAYYVLFALTNLHTPASLTGLFGTVYGVGVILASLIASWFARRLGEGRLLTLAMLTWGCLILLFSRCTSFVPGFVVFGLLGAVNGVSNICVGPLFLHLTPREFVGRASSVMQPAITLSSMLSAALSGYLVSGPLLRLHAAFLGMSFGALDTVILGAGFFGLVAGVYCVRALATVSTSQKDEAISPDREAIATNA